MDIEIPNSSQRGSKKRSHSKTQESDWYLERSDSFPKLKTEDKGAMCLKFFFFFFQKKKTFNLEFNTLPTEKYTLSQEGSEGDAPARQRSRPRKWRTQDLGNRVTNAVFLLSDNS